MKQLLILMLLPLPLAAQTAKWDAGSSNFLGSGASWTYYEPNQTLFSSIGYSNHHVIAGASDTFRLNPHETLGIGQQILSPNIDGASLAFSLLGVNWTKTTQDSTLQLFTGLTNIGMFQPYYYGFFGPSHFGAGLIATKKLERFEVSSMALFSGGQRTLANSISYHSSKIALIGSGGLIQNQSYLDGSMAARFHQFSFNLMHENLFVPRRITLDSTGVSYTWKILNLNAAIYRASSTGENAGIGFNFGPVQEQSSWFRSTGINASTFFYHTLTERISRFTLTENIAQNNGRNSYTFGGGYHSNRFTLTVNQAIQFLVTGQFEQVTSASISIRLPSDIVLHADSIVTPFGQKLYDVYGDKYQQRNGSIGSAETASIGKYIITGTCQQADQSVVEGCVIEFQLGKKHSVSISDSKGYFEFRTKKPSEVKVMPKPDEFVAAGKFEVIECPYKATPGEPIKVIVRRAQ